MKREYGQYKFRKCDIKIAREFLTDFAPDEKHDNKPYQRKDERIKVIHKKNGGLGFARNSGLDVASGKYVAFIDGDDYIGLTHIEKICWKFICLKTINLKIISIYSYNFVIILY